MVPMALASLRIVCYAPGADPGPTASARSYRYQSKRISLISIETISVKDMILLRRSGWVGKRWMSSSEKALTVTGVYAAGRLNLGR
jgi:hypothetical protein